VPHLGGGEFVAGEWMEGVLTSDRLMLHWRTSIV
jgi:hypothetical protein